MLKAIFEPIAEGFCDALRLYWALVTAPFVAVYRVSADFICKPYTPKSPHDRGRAQ